MNEKEYLGIYFKCEKGTNNNVYIGLKKLWLCSKHYQVWLTLKKDYHLKAIEQFYNE